MSSVKALVTGAAGYSGSYFCRVLVSKGYTVHAFDIDESVREKAEGCVPFVGDIRNVTDLRVAAAGCSVIFHMGAVVPFGFVDAADEFLLRQVNVAGTKNVVEAAILENVPFLVFISSTGVVFTGSPISNGDESIPIPDQLNCSYSKSKAEAEAIVLLSNGTTLSDGKRKLCTTAIRPNGIWGPGEQHHLPLLLTSATIGGHIFSFGKHARTDFTHRKNLAHALLLAEKRMRHAGHEQCGKAYFITDGGAFHTVTHFEPLLTALGFYGPVLWLPGMFMWIIAVLCEAISWILGKRLLNLSKMKPFVTTADVRKVVKDNYYSSRLAEEELGYVPVLSREDGLVECADYYEKEGASGYVEMPTMRMAVIMVMLLIGPWFVLFMHDKLSFMDQFVPGKSTLLILGSSILLTRCIEALYAVVISVRGLQAAYKWGPCVLLFGYSSLSLLLGKKLYGSRKPLMNKTDRGYLWITLTSLWGALFLALYVLSTMLPGLAAIVYATSR